MMTLATAWARPALQGAVKCTQPDGSWVTLELHGDEFYHFSTTTDGYTVLQNEQGVYEYARVDGNRLVSTGVQAHDADSRSADENALLAVIGRNVTDRSAIDRGKVRRAERDNGPARAFDQSKFRGLIILINFTDRKFSRSDAQQFYTNMMGQRGYTGYTNEDGTANSYGKFDGSVRDYFYAQSMGQFDPEFDVVGPILVNYKATQCQANSRAIFQAALKSADSQVDYSKYDGDGNGVVDNVCFIVAGWGSHVSGNNSGLLWPHESRSLMTTKLDGKSFDLYSCSTEMLSSESLNILEGVGTFCHEFTHVLGLPDFYDTDYDTNGLSHHPGEWDLMAGGADHNYGRTPVGYTLFERYAVGWAHPVVIKQAGSFTLENVATSQAGYILKTPKNNEYFTIENRQQQGWDRYLPGHGMIVTRVDSSSSYSWVTNVVNAKPTRNYFELLRAGNTTTGDLASDPFPGTMSVTHIDNDSYPSLRTWDKTANKLKIENIRESSGVISFDVMNSEDVVSDLVETFEGMPVMTTTPYVGAEGTFTTWDFAKSYVVEPGADYCTGTKAVSMVYPSQFTSATPIYYNVDEVRYDIYNTSSTSAKFGLSYSVNEGQSWVKAKNVMGSDAVTVPGNVRTSTGWKVPVTNTQPVQFRLIQNSGNKTVPVYVDNFVVIYHGEQGGPITVPGDVNGDNKVDVNDINIIINVMLGKQSNDKADVTGNGAIDVEDVNKVINLMLGK